MSAQLEDELDLRAGIGSAVTDNVDALQRTDDSRNATRAIYRAQQTAATCARCERTIQPEEPVWRQGMFLGFSCFGGRRYTYAPVCKGCRSDYREFWEAAPCKGCGRPVYDEINRSFTQKQHLSCSQACKHKSYAAAVRERRRRRRGTLACEICGKAYQPSRSDSRFCSVACKQRAYRKRISAS